MALLCEEPGFVVGTISPIVLGQWWLHLLTDYKMPKQILCWIRASCYFILCWQSTLHSLVILKNSHEIFMIMMRYVKTSMHESVLFCNVMLLYAIFSILKQCLDQMPWCLIAFCTLDYLLKAYNSRDRVRCQPIWMQKFLWDWTDCVLTSIPKLENQRNIKFLATAI